MRHRQQRNVCREDTSCTAHLTSTHFLWSICLRCICCCTRQWTFVLVQRRKIAPFRMECSLKYDLHRGTICLHCIVCCMHQWIFGQRPHQSTGRQHMICTRWLTSVLDRHQSTCPQHMPYKLSRRSVQRQRQSTCHRCMQCNQIPI